MFFRCLTITAGFAKFQIFKKFSTNYKYKLPTFIPYGKDESCNLFTNRLTDSNKVSISSSLERLLKMIFFFLTLYINTLLYEIHINILLYEIHINILLYEIHINILLYEIHINILLYEIHKDIFVNGFNIFTHFPRSSTKFN